MKDAFEWMRNRKITIKEAAGRYSELRLRRESPGIDRTFEAYLVYEKIITNWQLLLIEGTIKEWQICCHCKHWQFNATCIPLQDELEIECPGEKDGYVFHVATTPVFSCILWAPLMSHKYINRNHFLSLIS